MSYDIIIYRIEHVMLECPKYAHDTAAYSGIQRLASPLSYRAQHCSVGSYSHITRRMLSIHMLVLTRPRCLTVMTRRKEQRMTNETGKT